MIKTFDTVVSKPPPPGIVCYPSSDAEPNGNAETPRYHLDFSDLDNPVVKGLSSEQLRVGNCHWYGDMEGPVLSWLGPRGFLLLPEYTKVISGFTPLPVNDCSTLFLSLTGVTLTLPGQSQKDYDFYIKPRRSSALNCHGKRLPEAPYTILGAGMLGAVIVVVVSFSRTRDQIYYGTLTQLHDIGWTLAGEINVPDAPDFQFLGRQGIYSFSQDGSKFVSLLEAIDSSDTNGRYYKRIVVRGSIAIDQEVVSINSITFETVDHEFTARRQLNEVTNADAGFPEHVTWSRSTSYTEAAISQLHAIGFNGNIESRLDSGIITYSRNHLSVGEFGNSPDSGVTGNSMSQTDHDYRLGYYLDGALVCTNTLSVSDTESADEDTISAGSSSFLTINSNYQFSNTFNRLLYCSLLDQRVVYAEITETLNESGTVTISGESPGNAAKTGNKAFTFTIKLNHVGTIEYSMFTDSLMINDSIDAYYQHLFEGSQGADFGIDTGPGQSSNADSIINVPEIQTGIAMLYSLFTVDANGHVIGQVNGTFNEIDSTVQQNVFQTVLPEGHSIFSLFNLTGNEFNIVGSMSFINSICQIFAFLGRI